MQGNYQANNNYDNDKLCRDMIASVGRGSKIYRLTFGCFSVILFFYLIYCVAPFFNKGFTSAQRIVTTINFVSLFILAWLYLERLTTKYTKTSARNLFAFTVILLIYGICCMLYTSWSLFSLKKYMLFLFFVVFITILISTNKYSKLLFILSISFWMVIFCTSIIVFTNIKIILILIIPLISWLLSVCFLSNIMKQYPPFCILSILDDKNIDFYISGICKKNIKINPFFADDPRNYIILMAFISTLLGVLCIKKQILWKFPVSLYGLYWYTAVIFSCEGILLFYDKYYDLVLDHNY